MISSTIEVISGVPQGSCQGPVLFYLFVNDLAFFIRHSFLKLFADDVKIYLLTEVQLMQEDLDSLTQWCGSNSMFINPSTCVILHYGCKIPPNYTYLLSGTNVPSEEMVRDLGIHFNTQLKYDKHVSAIIRNANYHLLSLKRSFRKFNLRNFFCFLSLLFTHFLSITLPSGFY